MKLLLPLLSLLFAVCTPAAAADLSSIELSVELANGPKVLVNAKASTLDGQPVPISIGKEHAYVSNAVEKDNKVTITTDVVHEGVWIMLAPTLIKDGKIELDFTVAIAELVAIKKIKQGNMEVDLPEVDKINLKQAIVLDDGKEIVIPFCSIIKRGELGKAACSQYTIKLTARAI